MDAMSQNWLVNDFNWIEETSQFNEDFIEIYNTDCDIEYLIEVYVQYPEKLHELYNYLIFLPEKMKIEKIGKLVANLHDKKECATHITNLRQALNHALLFKKIHKVIKVNQKTWLKAYIDMIIDLIQILEKLLKM